MEHRITHSCGHEQAHYIPGFAAQQERKAHWLRTTTCRACFLAERRAEEAGAAASDAAVMAGLAMVNLAGSERQVGWATNIRARRLARLVQARGIGWATGHPGLVIADAKWWIDHRALTDDDLLAEAKALVGEAARPCRAA